MAQTKSRNSRSTTSSSRTKSGSRTQSSTGAAKRSGSTRRKSASASAKSRSSKAPARSGSRSSKTQASRKKAATSQSSGGIAQKVKGPALAGGAALVGLAGGVALQRNKRKGLMKRLPTPSLKAPKVKMPKVAKPNIKPDEALKTIGKAAGQVADRSQRVGHVASQVQQASEAIDKRR